MADVSEAAMKKIFRKCDQIIRVSSSAKTELAHTMKVIGEKICREAIRISRHSGRKTVQKEDVNYATEKELTNES